MAWETIDSAPKAGRIRLKGGKVLHAAVVAAEPKDGYSGEWRAASGPASEPGWYVEIVRADGVSSFHRYDAPTHWMPEPPKPQLQG